MRTLTPRKRSVTGPQLKAIHRKALELIADEEGSITLGWVDTGVFYARLIGTLSAELSARHVSRLEDALDRSPSLHYFGDGRALASYDLRARAAFREIVVTRRQQFKSIVLLTWAQGITPAAHKLATAASEPMEILADDKEFERRLLDVAPLARGKLDPNGWVLPSIFPSGPR
jgi:hypothetical protein